MSTDEPAPRKRTFIPEIIASIPTAWYFLHLFLDPQPWWMFFVNSTVPYLFVFPALMLLWGALRKNATTVVVALIPVILFLGLYGARFQPRTTQGPPENLTIMTYNMNAFNDDTGALRDLSIAEELDLLLLQELGRGIQPITPKDLQETLPHSVINPTHNLYGMGIFSRYPLTPIDAPELEPFSQHTQVAVLAHPAGEVLVVNIHNISVSLTGPSLAEKTRAEMIERQAVAEAVIQLVERMGMPTIVAGDFNSTEFSSTHQTYETTLVDAWQAKGFGFGHTFPGGPVRPTVLGINSPEWYVRIDYIFVTPDIAVSESRIGFWDGMSDHRPVVAAVHLPGKE